MLLKKGTIVRLTTAERPIVVEKDDEKVFTFPKGSLVFNASVMPSLKMVGNDEIVTPEQGYSRAHLYLLVEDTIKVNDFILMGTVVGPVLEGSENIGEIIPKVVASTDKLLGLPKFSKGMLTRYVEKQGIHQVYAVYEETHDTDGDTGMTEFRIIPKVNRNNNISLRKIKNSFTYEEVLNILHKFATSQIETEAISDWMETHI